MDERKKNSIIIGAKKLTGGAEKCRSTKSFGCDGRESRPLPVAVEMRAVVARATTREDTARTAESIFSICEEEEELSKG